ncbi:MAG: periplasmic heavy metal sensor [Pseudomonadota bacterium]
MSRQFWITGLLIVSLLVNALIIGIVIGRGNAPAKTEPPPPINVERPNQPVAPETRRYLREATREIGKEMRPKQQAHRESQQALRRAFQADPYDHEAMVEALKTFQETEADMRATLQSLILERMEDATPEQRRALIWLALRNNQGRRQGERRQRGQGRFRDRRGEPRP